MSTLEGKKLPGDINFRFASKLIHCKLAESVEYYTGSHVMYLHEFFIAQLSGWANNILHGQSSIKKQLLSVCAVSALK